MQMTREQMHAESDLWLDTMRTSVGRKRRTKFDELSGSGFIRFVNGPKHNQHIFVREWVPNIIAGDQNYHHYTRAEHGRGGVVIYHEYHRTALPVCDEVKQEIIANGGQVIA